MKKLFKSLICVLVVVLLISAFVGCAQTTVTYDPEPFEEVVDDYRLYLDETFNSVQDLSDCQGYRNWYYYCGDPEDGSLDYMVFNDFYGRWCSQYQTIYEFTYMWSSVWLPEALQGYGIGMSFKAPATGTLDVSVNLKLLQLPEFSIGDGVIFTISDINGDPYDGVSISTAEGDKDIPLHCTVDVKMGEEVLFMLFPNSGNKHDSTDVNITVKYIEE